MEHDFWHNKWETNEIGFHEEGGNPLLKKYIDILAACPSPRILVPLCGKTHDIGVLLAHGCDVIGVELSEVAVRQLFDELDVEPTIDKCGAFTRFSHQNLTVLVGDVLKLNTRILGDITGIYDRAALVALPETLRRDYADTLCRLAGDAKQLIITFDYHQPDMAGPPFSVTQEMVEALYAHHYTVSPLLRHPVEGGLKGQVAADCLVFSLSPKPEHSGQ